jgi:hypothetical protein
MESVEMLTTTYNSCEVRIDFETRKRLGIAENATVIMHSKDGRIEVEILPPPTPDLVAASDRLYKKYKEVSEELTRLGD